MILVHGMWSRPGVWNVWKAVLEDAGYRCLALTLPGHSASDDDRAVRGLGLEDYVADVAAAARQFDRPIVIGHSLGGLIAQHVATRVQLSALVLVSSAAPGQIFPLRLGVLPGVARHFLNLNLWRSSFRLSRFESKYLIFNNLEDAIRIERHDELTAESGRMIFEVGFGPLNFRGGNRVDIDAVACPVLALAGARDRIIPIGVSRTMARLYGKKVTYVEHDEHAHWMLGETGAERRAEEVVTWLATA